MIETVSALAMPLAVSAVGLLCLSGKRNYFNSFLQGARQGLESAVGLLPTLIALMVAVSMLNASGVTRVLADWLSPHASALGVPSELLPLLLTRPFSGSASTAAFSTLLREAGADSLAGLCASVIFASSDTVVYVISVYFSAIGVRRTRYAFLTAVAVMIFCIFFSCFFCRLRFF
jgi:spore maturation protein B